MQRHSPQGRTCRYRFKAPDRKLCPHSGSDLNPLFPVDAKSNADTTSPSFDRLGELVTAFPRATR